MKKKVLVTGGTGTIATVIHDLLGDRYDFTFTDIRGAPGGRRIRRLDILRGYADLCGMLRGMDAVIHLAWNPGENWRSQSVVPDNKAMAEIVYRTAAAAGVKRIVMASSIHADNFRNSRRGLPLMSCETVPWPVSPYGASKVYIESFGRAVSIMSGLGVICPRFGGVTADDAFRDEPWYPNIWLSRKDCARLIECCVETEEVPDGFHSFYGVSNNNERMHDWTNAIGWIPHDDSSLR